DVRLENALVRLQILFRDADTLGSLIDLKRATEISDPSDLQRAIEDVQWERVAPALMAAVAAESKGDVAALVLAADVNGLARAAVLLAREFTLVATNVPFLSRSKQAPNLRDYLRLRTPLSKGDLATAMLDRWVRTACTMAVVSPQNWQEKPGYTAFRR